MRRRLIYVTFYSLGIALAIIIGLTSCAAPETEWVAEPWARMSFKQSQAVCRAEMQKYVWLGFWDCMRQYGWRERGME